MATPPALPPPPPFPAPRPWVPQAPGPPSWGWYPAWAALGAAGALALLAVFTPLFLLVPVLGLLGLFLVSRPRARGAAPALLCGLALPVLFVAWLNRDGPGEVCTVTPSSSSCVEEGNPWPWVAVATALILAGVAGSIAARRAAARARARHEAAPAHAIGAEVPPRR
ncbi:MAG TPA: hypothetical protein VMT43_12790 [Acidimicrobiales bacterium]|nr:hypothetical protein [Acidimicrobiales bacterium]